LVGDVDFDEAKQRASWITPVPRGSATSFNKLHLYSLNYSKLEEITWEKCVAFYLCLIFKIYKLNILRLHTSQDKLVSPYHGSSAGL